MAGAQAPALALALAQAHDGTQDAGLGPITPHDTPQQAAPQLQPCRALPIRDLLHLWNHIEERPLKGWAQVRGPVGAALMSAKRLGWDISHPWLWVTDAGIQVSLLTTSPRFMAWHIKQSWTRLVSQRVASKLVANGYDALTGAIDFTTPRQVIESRATDALTPLQQEAPRFDLPPHLGMRLP